MVISAPNRDLKATRSALGHSLSPSSFRAPHCDSDMSKLGHKKYDTRSSARLFALAAISFARSAHSFACFALLASLVPTAALTLPRARGTVEDLYPIFKMPRMTVCANHCVFPKIFWRHRTSFPLYACFSWSERARTAELAKC